MNPITSPFQYPLFGPLEIFDVIGSATILDSVQTDLLSLTVPEHIKRSYITGFGQSIEGDAPAVWGTPYYFNWLAVLNGIPLVNNMTILGIPLSWTVHLAPTNNPQHVIPIRLTARDTFVIRGFQHFIPSPASRVMAARIVGFHDIGANEP